MQRRSTFLRAGRHEVASPETGAPAFAFRLHQSINRGDTVSSSPEPAGDRHLTLAGQRFVPGDRGKSFLPLAFCRACGHDYYVVYRQPARSSGKSSHAGRLTPRDIGDGHDDEARPGVLYPSDENPWPDDTDEVHERLPQDWFDEGLTLVPRALSSGGLGQRVESGPPPVDS